MHCFTYYPVREVRGALLGSRTSREYGKAKLHTKALVEHHQVFRKAGPRHRNSVNHNQNAQVRIYKENIKGVD